MKTSIGVRANPDEIVYSISESDDDSIEIKVIDKVVLPLALNVPEQLKFIRNVFLDILAEFKVTLACIRVTESSAKKTNRERLNFEAVLQELIASSSVEKYFVGQISNMSSKLAIPRADFKKYVDGTMAYAGMEDMWPDMNEREKESLC